MIKTTILLTILLLALPLVDQTHSQNITAEIRTSKSSVQIADPFDAIISVTAPAESKVLFPPISKTLGEFEVIAHDDLFDIPVSTPSSNQANQALIPQIQMRSWTRRMKLETLVTGQLTIPSLDIQITSPTSQPRSIATDEKQILVTSVIDPQADLSKIRDLKKEIDINVSGPISYAWIGWTLGALGGLAMLGLLIVKTATRKKWPTAKRWAMDQLEAIGQPENLQTNDAKIVFERIETTLKTYLQSSFGFPATKQSTDELLNSLKPFTSPENTARLSTLLRQSELAKYAGREFNEPQLRKTIDQAAELITSIENDTQQTANQAPTSPKTKEPV